MKYINLSVFFFFSFSRVPESSPPRDDARPRRLTGWASRSQLVCIHRVIVHQTYDRGICVYRENVDLHVRVPERETEMNIFHNERALRDVVFELRRVRVPLFVVVW